MMPGALAGVGAHTQSDIFADRKEDVSKTIERGLFGESLHVLDYNSVRAPLPVRLYPCARLRWA
jgi:hypothetical protein